MANKDEKLLKRCKEGLELGLERESISRKLWEADLKFANGDPENGYQWDETLRKSRETDQRPCLTVNKVKQHNRQITNDARQNKPSVRVQPVDDGADKETAEVLNGIIRHIESNSSADTAYDTAAEFAVDAGIGYWRVVTDYCDAESFDQDIFIRRVKNPLTIVLGPHNEADASDMRQGWVFDDLPKEEFKRLYPDAEEISYSADTGDSWNTEDTIRVCEYYEITDEKDTLIADANGETFLLSTIEDKESAKAIKADKAFKKREVLKPKLTWYKIAGDGQVLDRRDLLGKYVPIVKVVGEEIEIDGKIERKGHTRSMKDAQRMYNYNSSASIEYGALQTKVPIIAPAEALAGLETYWDTANTLNHAYLPYNQFGENGERNDRPDRMTAPAPAQLFLQGMATASEEMKMASGQYDASMGAKSNETSGRAIMARQREGDNATFHFIDNVARAIKYTGKILVDLIPKIYDTPRVARILGEDGKEDMAQLDPGAPKAFQEEKSLDGKINRIYNLGMGRYDVTVTVGPSYGTKRQEAADGMLQIAQGNPGVWNTHGDLIAKSLDWPMADDFAKRFEKMLPPELKDAEEGAAELPPEAQAQISQMQEQIKQMGEALENASNEVDKLEAEKVAKDSEIEIKRVEANTKAYQAITDRLKVVGPLLNPVDVQELASETKREAMVQPDPGNAPAESMGVPEQIIEQQEPMPEPMEPQGMPEAPPPEQDMQQNEPPQGGFFTPEETQEQ